MVIDSSNQPGWGAQESSGRGSSSGSSSSSTPKPEPPKPNQWGETSGGGTGTSAPGAIDKPGEATEKMVSIGGIGGREGTPGNLGTTPIPTLEQVKQSEIAAATKQRELAQAISQTTPQEATKLQAMLRSPTAQFAPGAGQTALDVSSRYVPYAQNERISVSEIKSTNIGVESKQYDARGNKIIVTPTEIKSTPIKLGFYPAQPGSFAEQAQSAKDKQWLPEGVGGTKPLPVPVSPKFDTKTPEYYASRQDVIASSELSESLQSKYETIIGYNKETSGMGKTLLAGVGQAITSLPAFGGQLLFAGEALVRHPIESIKGVPEGAVILGKQLGEQITENPIKFVGFVGGNILLSGGGKSIALKGKEVIIKRIEGAKQISPNIVNIKGLKEFSASESGQLLNKKRSVTQLQQTERPKVAEELSVETIDVTSQSQASYAQVKPRTTYELQFAQSQGSAYGKYKTQFQVEQAKAPVKLMSQAERDIIINKIKATQEPVKVSMPVSKVYSGTELLGESKAIQTTGLLGTTKLMSQAERDIIINKIKGEETIRGFNFHVTQEPVKVSMPVSKVYSGTELLGESKAIQTTGLLGTTKQIQVTKAITWMEAILRTKSVPLSIQRTEMKPMSIQKTNNNTISLMQPMSLQKQSNVSLQEVKPKQELTNILRQDLNQVQQQNQPTLFDMPQAQSLKQQQETRIIPRIQTIEFPRPKYTPDTPVSKKKKIPPGTDEDSASKKSRKKKKDITAEDILKEPPQVNPWYPASLEALTKEELGLSGKRATQIKPRKTTQRLFKRLKTTGKAIPTESQYKAGNI